MQTGEDLANIVGRVAGELAVESIRTGKEIIEGSSKFAGAIAGGITRAALQLILNKIAERNSLFNPGKTNLKNLLKSEKDLKMSDIKAEDVKLFADKAKKFGLVFAVIKDKDTKHIVYKAEDIERAEKIFKLAIAEKMKLQEQQKEMALKKAEIEKEKVLKAQEKTKNKKANEKTTTEKAPKASVRDSLAKIEVSKRERMERIKAQIKEMLNEGGYKEKLNIADNKNIQMKIMKLEAKLEKEQQPPGRKDVDIPNNTISIKAHNEKNKVNENFKLRHENRDLRESVRQKLNNIAKSRVIVKGGRSKMPVIKKGRDR